MLFRSVGGNSVRATGGMNAGKTVYQDENEFAESAGVEKTLKAAAEKYADNETITALAATVAEQWVALLKMLSAQCSEHLVDDVALLRFIGVYIHIERCRYVGVS